MSDKKKLIKWSVLLFVAALALAPLQMLFLIDYETDKAYWCSVDHYNSDRCAEAEGAVGSTVWTLAFVTLVLLSSLGILMDRMLLPPDHEHDATLEVA